MLDIDHGGNVIDVNKKGGRLPILLSKIYLFQTILWGCKLALKLCHKWITYGHINQESGIAWYCTPSSLQIPSPSHVIGHLEVLKSFKECNLLYNKYVKQTPWGDEITKKEL